MGVNGTNGKVDMGLFHKNRVKVNLDMLDPYIGKHIAWNGDASAIVASADTYDALYEKLDAMGVAGDEVVHDYIEDGTTLL